MSCIGSTAADHEAPILGVLILCPDCGADNREDSKFCCRCGRPFGSRVSGLRRSPRIG